MEILKVIEEQRQFVRSGQARDLQFRLQQLRKLKKILKQNEASLTQAIFADFKKSVYDTYLTELGIIYHEIDIALCKLKKWAKPKCVGSPLVIFPARCFVKPEPLGCALIIGTWNYPYQLTLGPMIAAMAAGNTCVVKPSELTSHCSKIMAKLINENFPSPYLHVFEGGVQISEELLRHRFDKIFFTGSTAVGKIVARAAAEYLTPVTLELGGKSPCIVLPDADIQRSAQRIVWGKFINAGQTCVAPDYLLVHENIHGQLLAEIKIQIAKIIGADAKNSECFPRIINQRHTERLKKLIEPDKIYCGGAVVEGEHYVEPTVLHKIRFSDEIMKEEIFGPLLPVIQYQDLNAIIEEINNRPHPLSLYIFGKNSASIKDILAKLPFGGGAVNDVVLHLVNSNLPFGGVGDSGMGSYHGEAGFKTFSHYKSILLKPLWFEPFLKYRPYTDWKLKLLRWILG